MPSELVYVRNKHTGDITQMSREALDGYASGDFELTPQQKAADKEASPGNNLKEK
jgi:hypothetical protein